MFILNKKTGTVQECHNKDAIKVCKKDTDNYAVAEKREELLKKSSEKPIEGLEREEAKNVSHDAEKPDPGAARGVQNGENGEGKRAEGEEEGELDEAALKTLSVIELREVAKRKGIQGYGNMNKETLVATILNH